MPKVNLSPFSFLRASSPASSVLSPPIFPSSGFGTITLNPRFCGPEGGAQKQRVTVNFGKDLFVFDIKAYEAQERAKQQNMIEKISLPQNISYGIVRSYLLHYGYEETLNSFELANKTSVPPVTIAQENGFGEHNNLYALSQRKALRQALSRIRGYHFSSISVLNKHGKDDFSYKVFSRSPLDDSLLDQIFSLRKKTIKIDCAAYPHYNAPESFALFVLDGLHLYYVSAFESAASTMETSAVSAENISRLILSRLSRQPFESSSNSESSDPSLHEDL